MNESDERRELYRGVSGGWQRAVELTLVPVGFGALGRFLDGRLGWSPILTLLLGLLAVVGVFIKIFIEYSAEMDAHDRNAVWSRK